MRKLPGGTVTFLFTDIEGSRARRPRARIGFVWWRSSMLTYLCEWSLELG